MKPILFIVLTVFLLESSAPLLHGQEAVKDRNAAGAEKDLLQKLIGYWVIDFDSAAAKVMFASDVGGKAGAKLSREEVQNMKKEMGGVTFEIKEGFMVDYVGSMSSRTKLSVKSQDPATRTLMFDALTESQGKSVEVKIVVDGDRITMSGKKDDGEVVKFGLKRIDKEAFEKRVAEAHDKSEALPEEDKESQKSKDGYPVAASVPDKPGFVLSPYNKKVVDVRGFPSGTLVMDPTTSSAEKKYFRVP